MSPPIISELFVYPLKSARGVPLKSAELASTGFKYDRRFMLVDASGKFITQRSSPELALVHVELLPNALRFDAPNMNPLTVPLGPNRAGSPRQVTVWRHSGPAISMGEEARAWFSQYLRLPADLMFMQDDTQRLSSIGQRPISFVDAYPFLMLSRASLDALNARLGATGTLALDRFRPNIVVTGCDPHAEDGWPIVRCGAIEFIAAKPCERCAIICTDQQTARRDVEPLATLATYRRYGNAAIFGQYFTHRGSGFLSIGQPLQVGADVES